MLQAMNTGHEGSISTIHSNTPRDALARLETMVMMSGMDLPSRAIREQVAAAIHMIVQIGRLSDGSRKVISVSEIQGMEGNVIVLQDLFAFQQKGIGEGGKLAGELRRAHIAGLELEHQHPFVLARNRQAIVLNGRRASNLFSFAIRQPRLARRCYTNRPQPHD